MFPRLRKRAGIAQLVEHDLAKVGVAGSSPVSRSTSRSAPRESMRSATRVLVALVIVAAGMSQLPAARGVRFGLALAPGDPAPRIRLPLLNGDSYDHVFEEHAFTLVNFWATWCKPCREEMPALQRLIDKHRGAGLSVLGILFDPRSDDEGARRYLEETGVRYPTMRARLDTLQVWGGIGMFPTSFLIDREGRIVRRYVGASPAQVEGLVQDVEAVLSGRPLGSMVIPDPEPRRSPE
jgi:thiol-disulfide isomerase/thioredoxin